MPMQKSASSLCDLPSISSSDNDEFAPGTLRVGMAMMTAICKDGPFANVRGSRSSPSNRRGRCARSGCGVDRWARLTADNVA